MTALRAARTRLRRFLAAAVPVAATVGLAAGGAAPASAATTTDAITANAFALTIGGYEVARFSELLGVSTPTQGESWGTSTVIRPGSIQPSTITLKRQLSGDKNLAMWHASGIRRDAVLTVYGNDGQPLVRYWLAGAFPMKIELIDGVKEIVTFTCYGIQKLEMSGIQKLGLSG